MSIEKSFALVAAGFLIGVCFTAVMVRDRQEIIKTNIGEFIIRNNKVYTVYELSRDQRGDLGVTR
jgi:hypothetical protein